MKKMYFAFVSLFMMAFSAHADQTVQLANINLNNCNGPRGEVLLLSSPAYMVNAVCSDYLPGGYHSNNGKYYDYRLYTTVSIPGGLAYGQTIELGAIYTNNCERARALVSMLSTRSAVVTPTCSPYVPQGYQSSNGRLYDYRMTTLLTVY